MKKSVNVNEYISKAPKEMQERLKKIRATIKSVAPNAEEKLSYGMPYYGYKGRLAYFAHRSNYIGLYIPPPVIKDHRLELKNYVTTKSSVHLPMDEKLPLPLVKKLIKARIKFNESKR